MRRFDARQCVASLVAHRGAHLVMRKHAVTAEETRERSVQSRHSAAGGAEPERRIEIAGDHTESRAQLTDVPMLAAEQPQRRRAVLRGARPIIEREQPDQRGLAGTVRAKNRGVLALM